MKSLKTIFNEVYGEGLAEYGFKKVPGKQPYFARVIGDEIVQVITYRTVSSSYRDCRCFVQMCGVVTVYRENFRFESEPDFLTSYYHELRQIENNIDLSESLIDYCTKDEEDMKKTVLRALDNCKKYFIPTLDEINTLVDCLEYYVRYDFYRQMDIHDYFADDIIEKHTDCSEGMLLYKCFDENDSKKMLEKYYDKSIEYYNKMIYKVEHENQRKHYLDSIERTKIAKNNKIEVLEKTYHDENKIQYIQKVLDERKNRNTEELRKYKLL